MAGIDDAMWRLGDIISSIAGTGKVTGRVTATYIKSDPDGTAWFSVPGNPDAVPIDAGAYDYQLGDTVTIDTSGMVPVVVSNDTDPTGMRRVTGMVREVRNLAQDARAIADAIGQFFWHDDNGAHVSTEEGNPTGAQNTVWNALGMLFRKGHNVVLAIVTGDDPGMDVYDGAGNENDNILASYRGSGSRIGYLSGFNSVVQAGLFAIRHATDRLFSVETDGLSVDISMGGSTKASDTNYTDAKVEAVHRFLSSGCTVADGVVYDPNGNDTSYTVTSLGFVKDGNGKSFSSASYSDITYMNGLFGLEPQLYPQSEILGVPVSIDMGNVNVSAESGLMNIVGSTTVTGRAFSNSAKLLWSGGYHMTADQTATLSEHVSDQPNGIVLVWSGYSGGQAQNYQWHFDYIPKAWVSHHSSDTTRGITCIMAGAGFNPVATKYVYVNFGIFTSDTITGHANNNQSGTANGISYSNGSFVLREVWGV